MSAVARLALQQQALLDALWPVPGGASTSAVLRGRGLDAYRANATAHAVQALAHAYPVVRALVGEDGHAALAGRLWASQPPRRGDLAQWGHALPASIDGLPDLADLPYLADVARVEWAMHEAAGAPDAPPMPDSLARLVDEDPAQLTLCLAPGAAILASPWPVVSIVRAHIDNEPTLAECGERLRQGVAETALVWRAGWRPRLRAIDLVEVTWLNALMHGAAVDAALDAALAVGAFDIAGWLMRSAQDGLLLGAIDRPPASRNRPR